MFNLLSASRYGDAICLRISSRISFGFFAFAICQSSTMIKFALLSLNDCFS